MRPISLIAAALCFVCSSCSAMELAPHTFETAAAARPLAQPPLTVLYRFRGHLDGARPEAELTEVDGVFYGTTTEGGSNPRGCFCGTVFSLDEAGHETVLHRFKGGSDGASPQGSLTYLNGTFYGTTTRGGLSYCSDCGTLFALSATGTLRSVHDFHGIAGSTPDGERPSGKLVALDGKIYGTTQGGGTPTCNCGTVFVFDPSSGKERPLHIFSGGTNGSIPLAGLTLIGKSLYGTTSGGSGCDGKSCGSIFRIDTSGAFHLIHSFSGSDGAYPWSNPVQIGATLYGTTYNGGNGCFVSGCGTIYAIDKSGKERVVWLFGVNRDGAKPVGHLAVEHGQIYGTTQQGGNAACYRQYGCGTIFRFDPSTLEETKLRTFTAREGYWPVSGVIARDGILYGTADEGAIRSWGSIFSLPLN